MQYQQSGKNPFEGDSDKDPFHRAQYARAGEHHEFRRSVRINRMNQQTLGHYPSTIMQVNLPYHSALELAGIQWLDLQPCVRALWAQPDTFHYELKGKKRRYTPDIGVKLDSGETFMVEVKPWDHLTSKKGRRLWRHIGPVLKKRGLQLAFLVDKALQAEPLTNHLRAIQRFRGPTFDHRQIWELQTSLDRDSPWTLDEILPVLTKHGFAEDQFFGLVLNRHLFVNLTKRLVGSSHVWIPSRAPRIKIWAEYHAS